MANLLWARNSLRRELLRTVHMLAVANVGLAQRTWLGSLRRVISCNICHRPVFPRQFVMDDNWEHVVSLICADLLQNAHKSVIETKLEIAKELTLLSKEVSMPLIKPDSQTLSYFLWFVGVWSLPERPHFLFYSKRSPRLGSYQNGHTTFGRKGHSLFGQITSEMSRSGHQNVTISCVFKVEFCVEK